MSSRLRSDFWVAAFINRLHVQGGFAVVAKKGEAEAGAIILMVENLSTKKLSLYVPASQSEIDGLGQRKFMLILENTTHEILNTRLTREIKRDQDLWIIHIESLRGETFLEPNELILWI